MFTNGSDVRDIQASDSKRNHHKHDPAPLSIYNQHTITECWISDHETMVRKNHQNNGHTGSSCLDAGGGGGVLPSGKIKVVRRRVSESGDKMVGSPPLSQSPIIDSGVFCWNWLILPAHSSNGRRPPATQVTRWLIRWLMQGDFPLFMVQLNKSNR